MWSFSEVIDGMKEACEAFETPVVSGNVSFYNETDGQGILPTPTIGMVGLIEDTRKLITHGFKNENDLIAILGVTKDDLAASEYAQIVLGCSTDDLIAGGEVPEVDLGLEKQVHETLLKLADEMLAHSAHDCADGGLAVAIAECCFSSLGRDAIGADINLQSSDLSTESFLFGETPSRIVISFAENDLDKVREIAGTCAFEVIGRVGGSRLRIAVAGNELVAASVSELESAWKDYLKDNLEI